MFVWKFKGTVMYAIAVCDAVLQRVSLGSNMQQLCKVVCPITQRYSRMLLPSPPVHVCCAPRLCPHAEVVQAPGVFWGAAGHVWAWGGWLHEGAYLCSPLPGYWRGPPTQYTPPPQVGWQKSIQGVCKNARAARGGEWVSTGSSCAPGVIHVDYHRPHYRTSSWDVKGHL